MFSDVSLTDDRQFAKELFTAMIPLKKHWGGLVTVKVANDDELLDLMVKSGCIYLLIGFESTTNSSLYGMSKRYNNPENYYNVVHKLHNHGITVQGCFIFGLDHDTTEVFKKAVQVVNDLKIDIPRYAIATPYPETKLFTRLKAEKRILHEY